MSRAIAPARAGVARQPQAPADADHVRVERHDQPGGRHARPDAEIERVAPHHPAQKQVQPLAARCPPTAAERSSRRPAASARGRTPPEVERQRARRKAVERRADVVATRRRRRRGRTLRSIRSDRSSAAAATASATRSAPARPAVDDAGERRRRRARGSKRRTYAAGSRPITASTRSIDCSTLVTRPNASAAAQKPTISRSSARSIAPDDLNRIGRRVGVVEARRRAGRAPAFSPPVCNLQSAICDLQ